MSKRNAVAYIKPPDPSFLKQMKADAGYKEGPTIEDKRARLDDDVYESDSESGSDFGGTDAPEVVVVNRGDLTAEEAKKEKKRIEKEENEKPADLSERIVFKSKRKDKAAGATESKAKDQDKKAAPPGKSTLSFADEDEEDDEDDEEDEEEEEIDEEEIEEEEEEEKD